MGKKNPGCQESFPDIDYLDLPFADPLIAVMNQNWSVSATDRNLRPAPASPLT